MDHIPGNKDLAKTGVFFLNRNQVVDWLHNKARVDTEISNSEFVRFHVEIRNFVILYFHLINEQPFLHIDAAGSYFDNC